MSGSLRTSTIRATLGGALALAGILVAVFMLPDASAKQRKQTQAAQQAENERKRQGEEVVRLQALSERLDQGRARMEEILSNLPKEGEGALKWRLREALHEFAGKRGVNIRGVKYGNPTRDGAKDTDLEAMDVEFTASGIYQNLKPFMLDLEGSKLPFGLVSAKLEESPDGARLTITLRAFRRTGIIKGAARESE